MNKLLYLIFLLLILAGCKTIEEKSQGHYEVKGVREGLDYYIIFPAKPEITNYNTKNTKAKIYKLKNEDIVFALKINTLENPQPLNSFVEDMINGYEADGAVFKTIDKLKNFKNGTGWVMTMDDTEIVIYIVIEKKTVFMAFVASEPPASDAAISAVNNFFESFRIE